MLSLHAIGGPKRIQVPPVLSPAEGSEVRLGVFVVAGLDCREERVVGLISSCTLRMNSRRWATLRQIADRGASSYFVKIGIALNEPARTFLLQ